jgi:acetone carboxylase gamma subunit
MISKANVKEIEATNAKSVERKESFRKSDRARDLYSSFRRKSTLVDPKLPRKQWVSAGTLPPKPPKLRDLIQEAGILEELENDDDMQSILDEEIDDFSAIWSAVVDQPNSNFVDQTLTDVMEELLTMDDQDSIPCTCSHGMCLYHPNQDAQSRHSGEDTKSSFENISIPSPRSTDSSFVEIPHYCVPQFEPQYLALAQPRADSTKGTEISSIPSKTSKDSAPPPPRPSRIDFQLFSPPHHDPSQPSRTKGPPAGKGPPEGKPPLSGRPPRRTTAISPPTKVPKENPSEEDEDMVNSSHLFPSSIRRFDSFQSYQSMLSEITIPWEMNSLKIDSRAPQYRMAIEQQQEKDADKTFRMNNQTGGRLPPAPFSTTRRETPPYESPIPPARKRTPTDPHETTPSFGFQKKIEEEEEEPPVREALGRKGTLGGLATMQPAGTSQQPQGPFVSPGSTLRPVYQGPSTPRQDSNPLLFPADLNSPSEASNSKELRTEPFSSPGSAPRRFIRMPSTPQHDSNPLTFPRGLGCFPPSPKNLPGSPIRPATSPANMQALLLPLDTDSIESSIQEDAPLRKYSGRSTGAEDETKESIEVTTRISIRVKLSLMEISYITEGQEHMHSGLYSGPVNRRGLMDGNGVFWFTTGDLYLGQFCEGRLHGIGAMSITSEDGTKQIVKGYFRYNEFVGEEEDDTTLCLDETKDASDV